MIGRNNGGGQLAWALARGIHVGAAVLVGAIPEISLYRKQSQSASAVTFRNALADETEFFKIDDMKPLDIIASSKQWAISKCLMQFGQNDPYIDETADNAAERLSNSIGSSGWTTTMPWYRPLRCSSAGIISRPN